MMRALGALVLSATLAACAIAPSAPPAPTPAPVPAPSAADRLLARLVALRSLDEVALAAETARARAEAERLPTDASRLEAALALAVAPGGDEDAILALVAPVLRLSPPAAPEHQAMAGFLQGMALERRKLREGAAAAGTRVQAERKEALAWKQRADAQQDRADRLQKKLEALTNLEKSLANRKHADDPRSRPR